MTLSRGLHDRVVTESVARALSEIRRDDVRVDDLSAEEAAERLSGVLHDQLQQILQGVDGRDADQVRAQLALVNGLIAQLRGARHAGEILDPVDEPARVLRAVRRPGDTELAPPETGLWAPWLFSASKGSPSLLTELRREAAACDRINILVSFITLSGVRKLIDVLRTATAAGATGEGRTRIRVLTTTYTGATEIEALEQLAGLGGCEVKVSLDGRRTRLHAKAWIFERSTGFGSAYVGSANLSGAALMGGLEWTTKFTQRGQQGLFDRALAHFETLWADDEFTTYRPGDAASR
ncbi:MAG TPA: hypothetical protein VG818_09740, partial [Gemmatimonadaceae bacterium]|nr:hypothetical protein [Gemmatimonadaceae bacterium]